jgi:prepilin-type N-terminal cleavage/methylation domain-containing protein/prepilin-type processing-associated H-X9-DG protein
MPIAPSKPSSSPAVPSTRRNPARFKPATFTPAGFTLVELLVVIGIIALLISILLPALGKAREQGNTVKCLANLRSIGQACKMYESANKGFVVPADVMDRNAAAAVPAPANTYQDVHETWTTILVADKYLSYPEGIDVGSPPGQGAAPGFDSVFRCPSGVLESAAVTFGSTTVPSSRKDARGAMASLATSCVLQPGLNVYCWYGCNATNDESDPVNVGFALPMARNIIRSGGTVDLSHMATSWRKATQVRKGTDLVMFFDGLYGFNYITNNANRINARHNGQKYTNVVMCDGHAETVKTSEIPGGDGVAATSDFTRANIVKWPYPKWRMEQN